MTKLDLPSLITRRWCASMLAEDAIRSQLPSQAQQSKNTMQVNWRELLIFSQTVLSS